MSITVYSCREQLPPDYYLIDCAVSGGTLRQRLISALEQSRGQLIVELAPIYARLSLPCPDGQGERISPKELGCIHRDQPCYYSHALGIHYFTYLSPGLQVVLYDSIESLGRKLTLLKELSVPGVLIEDRGLRNALFP